MQLVSIHKYVHMTFYRDIMLKLPFTEKLDVTPDVIRRTVEALVFLTVEACRHKV
jgi:hypothetical protein